MFKLEYRYPVETSNLGLDDMTLSAINVGINYIIISCRGFIKAAFLNASRLD